jgi:hypothetical protein
MHLFSYCAQCVQCRLSHNHSCALLLLIVETKFTSSKPSSPAAYKQKKFVAESSLPAANGSAIACSNLSKDAVKLSETSLPLANGGTIVRSNSSKHAQSHNLICQNMPGSRLTSQVCLLLIGVNLLMTLRLYLL